MDDLKVHRVIGKGAEGTVYEVSDLKGNRFAMKRKLLLPDQPRGVALLNGIDIQRSTDHPNIVKIDKILSEKDVGDFLILYPLALDSLDLALHESELDLSPDTILRFMWEIGCGVAYLHENGIIHRDLKTANVLIFEEGDGLVCKLTDFGLSKYHITHLVQNTIPVVTVNYRAPELFTDTKNYGLEIDVWSLGCIYYELVFRKIMICGHSDEECKTSIENFKLPDVRDNYDIRDWLDQYEKGTFDSFMILLAKMLDPDPSERITIKQVLESNIFKNFEYIQQPPIYKNYEYCFNPNPYRKEGIVEILKMYHKHSNDLRALRTLFMAVDLFDRVLNDESFENGSKSQIFFLAHVCHILACRYYCTYRIDTNKISKYLSNKFNEDITELAIRTTQSYIFEKYPLYRETLFEHVIKGIECRLENDLEHSFGYQPINIIKLFLKMSYTLNYQSYQYIGNIVLDETIINLHSKYTVQEKNDVDIL